MNSPCGDDPMLQNLARLRPLAPDPARAQRVRARCHAQLARGRRRSQRVSAIERFARRVLAPAVVGGLCVLYVAALVATALRLHRLFYVD